MFLEGTVKTMQGALNADEQNRLLTPQQISRTPFSTVIAADGTPLLAQFLQLGPNTDHPDVNQESSFNLKYTQLTIYNPATQQMLILTQDDSTYLVGEVTFLNGVKVKEEVLVEYRRGTDATYIHDFLATRGNPTARVAQISPTIRASVREKRWRFYDPRGMLTLNITDEGEIETKLGNPDFLPDAVSFLELAMSCPAGLQKAREWSLRRGIPTSS